MKSSLRVSLLFLLSCSSRGYALDTASAPAVALSVITAAAGDARQRCFGFMHEDADEYVSCIDALDQAVPARQANAKYTRLGINYFGWVGANNSARLSLPGSERAAQHYLRRFRKLQQQLGIEDEALCGSVAGDCVSRLAQIRAGERELKQMAKNLRK
ncbi:MAG: hypothetical protein V4724_11545 [Pseudomonadota bacterium]